jgi:hypothetical protein
MGVSLGRYHSRRDDTAGRRGEGVQADRGNLRQISDQPELSPTGGEQLCDDLRQVRVNAALAEGSASAAKLFTVSCPVLRRRETAIAEVKWLVDCFCQLCRAKKFRRSQTKQLGPAKHA